MGQERVIVCPFTLPCQTLKSPCTGQGRKGPTIALTTSEGWPQQKWLGGRSSAQVHRVILHLDTGSLKSTLDFSASERAEQLDEGRHWPPLSRVTGHTMTPGNVPSIGFHIEIQLRAAQVGRVSTV